MLWRVARRVDRSHRERPCVDVLHVERRRVAIRRGGGGRENQLRARLGGHVNAAGHVVVVQMGFDHHPDRGLGRRGHETFDVSLGIDDHRDPLVAEDVRGVAQTGCADALNVHRDIHLCDSPSARRHRSGWCPTGVIAVQQLKVRTYSRRRSPGGASRFVAARLAVSMTSDHGVGYSAMLGGHRWSAAVGRCDESPGTRLAAGLGDWVVLRARRSRFRSRRCCRRSSRRLRSETPGRWLLRR